MTKRFHGLRAAPLLALATLAGIALTATPALAKKEKKPATVGRNWVISEGFRAQAEPVENDIKQASFDAAIQKLAALDKLAATPDEKYVSASLRYRVGTERNDLKQLYLGAANMLASGGAPESRTGELASLAGRYAFLMNNHKSARSYFLEAAKRGVNAPDQSIMLAESSFRQGLHADGMTAAKEALRLQGASGSPVPDSWWDKTESLLVSGSALPELAEWNLAFIRSQPTPMNWYARLNNYWSAASNKYSKRAGFTPLDDQAGLDLYRLLRATRSLRNGADLVQFSDFAIRQGAPIEARDAINDGWSASLIERGDKQATTLMAQAVKPRPKPNAKAAEWRRLLADADNNLQSGAAAKAVPVYRTALGKAGADADLINTRLGIALFRAGQKAEARTAFEAVQGARKGIAQFWILFLDTNPA